MFINAVTVTPDGKSWWSSPAYGIASFDGKRFTYYSPSQTGASSTVADMVALPDGRESNRGIPKRFGKANIQRSGIPW